MCLHLYPLLTQPYSFIIRRAGRFGTKGLAITFVSSDSDQDVMTAIQSRFEVAVPELPDHIDPATYSMARFFFHLMKLADRWILVTS